VAAVPSGLSLTPLRIKNTEKTKYMLLSYHQNTGKNDNMKIVKRCFENVAQFRYLGMTITNQNPIQKKIKMRLNSGSTCYHSFQNLSGSIICWEVLE
jgi:hypothetical protein